MIPCHLFFQIIKYRLKHLQTAVVKSFQWVRKKSQEIKDETLTLFSKTQWQKLHQEEKLNDSVFDCKQCQ